MLTYSTTSSPATALTWLAKPSRSPAVWVPVTTQSMVPGRWFSRTSQAATGTVTPLARVTAETAGGGAAFLALACGRLAADAGEPARAPPTTAASPVPAPTRKRRRSMDGPASGGPDPARDPTVARPAA